MTRSTVLLTALLAVVLLVAAVGAANAQDDPITPRPVNPVPCEGMSIYDLTGDQKVNWEDFEKWVRRVHWGGDACTLGSPASDCPMWLDINGDGVISHADLDALNRFYMYCAGPPRNIRHG